MHRAMLHPVQRQSSAAAPAASLPEGELRAERVARLGRAAREGTYRADARDVAAALLARVDTACACDALSTG